MLFRSGKKRFQNKIRFRFISVDFFFARPSLSSSREAKCHLEVPFSSLLEIMLE